MTTTLDPRTSQPRVVARARAPYYIWAVVVFVLGMMIAALWGFVGIFNAWQAPDGFARTALPGEVIVQVDQPGTQYVYYEQASGAHVPSLGELFVGVTGPAGQDVTVHEPAGTLEYDAGDGDLGTAVATFEATRPGSYAVQATSPDNGASLAVGPSLAAPMQTPFLGAAGVFGVTLLGTLALVALGRSKRA